MSLKVQSHGKSSLLPTSHVQSWFPTSSSTNIPLFPSTHVEGTTICSVGTGAEVSGSTLVIEGVGVRTGAEVGGSTLGAR